MAFIAEYRGRLTTKHMRVIALSTLRYLGFLEIHWDYWKEMELADAGTAWPVLAAD